MKKLVLFIFLLISFTCNAFLYENTTVSKFYPNISYQYYKGKLLTLSADENTWRNESEIMLVEDNFAFIPNRVDIVAGENFVFVYDSRKLIRFALDNRGIPANTYTELWSHNSGDYFNVSIHQSGEYLFALNRVDNELVINQFKINNDGVALERTYDNFNIDTNIILHSNGSLVSTSLRYVIPFVNGRLTEQVRLTNVNSQIPDSRSKHPITFDKSGNIYYIQSFGREVKKLNWPVSQSSTPTTLLSQTEPFATYNNIFLSSNEQHLLAIENASQETNYTLIALTDNSIYETTLSALEDQAPWLSYFYWPSYPNDQFDIFSSPIAVNSTIWLGPVKFDTSAPFSLTGYQNPLFLTNDAVVAENRNFIVLDDQLFVQNHMGFMYFNIDEDNKLTNKRVLETKINSNPTLPIHINKLGAVEYFVTTYDARDSQLYAQVYNGGQKVSEYELGATAFHFNRFDRLFDIAHNNSVFVAEKNQVFFSIHSLIYACQLSDSREISSCASYDQGESASYSPEIDRYRNGIVFYEHFSSQIRSMVYNGDALEITNNWRMSDAVGTASGHYSDTTDTFYFTSGVTPTRTYQLIDNAQARLHDHPIILPSEAPLIDELSVIDNLQIFLMLDQDKRQLPLSSIDRADDLSGDLKSYLGNGNFLMRQKDELLEVMPVTITNKPLAMKINNVQFSVQTYQQYQKILLNIADFANINTLESASLSYFRTNLDRDEVVVANMQSGVIDYDIAKDIALMFDQQQPLYLVLRGTNWQTRVKLPYTIVNVNEAPQASAVEDQRLRVNESYGGDLHDVFSDPDGDSLTFSVTGLPAGLTLEQSIISGAPTQRGTFNVEVVATDSAGLSNAVTFRIIVGDTDNTTNNNSNTSTDNASGGGSQSIAILLFLLIMICIKRNIRFAGSFRANY